MSFNYSDSGVDINLGDTASEILFNATKETWKNREGLGKIILPYDDFSGVRYIHVSKLPLKTIISMGLDGLGTKSEVGERAGYYSTMANDLFAMVCDDAVAKGGEPVLAGSILDVNSLKNLNIEKIRELAIGYINAAKEANVAIINGETAELGNRVNGYGPFNFNWGASIVWFSNEDKVLTGKKIVPGDYLVGLREKGFRTNGLSLFRKIMEKDEDWHKIEYDGKTFGERALEPSRIYTRPVVDMFGGYKGEQKVEIHGIAHITGGGIPSKLGRVLKPTGLGAYISEAYDPSYLMFYSQDKGNVSDRDAYNTWNMGQGMIVISPEPEKVMDISREYDIGSKVIGEVIEKPGITIRSRGLFSYGKSLVF